ncbi:MAG: histidine kinase [Saprospiraceae bacterium]
MEIKSARLISESEGNMTTPLSKAFLLDNHQASLSVFPIDLFDQVHWKSWFWGSGGIMFLIALIHFYRDKKLKAVRELKILRKIKRLEQTALRSQMNPHFIFNALNSIQSFIVNGDKKSSVVYLAKFSRLVRSVLHFSSSTTISLKEELEMLNNYLELEKLRFSDSFHFNLVVDPDLNLEKTMLPPLLVQPIVENAILHGIGPLNREGFITVYFKQTKSALWVTVSDNGIGINTSKKLKERNGTSRKSVGIQLTKKRLQLLSGGNSENRLNVREIEGNNGEVLGTEFKMKIPQKITDDNIVNYFYPVQLTAN